MTVCLLEGHHPQYFVSRWKSADRSNGFSWKKNTTAILWLTTARRRYAEKHTKARSDDTARGSDPPNDNLEPYRSVEMQICPRENGKYAIVQERKP